MFYAVMLSRAAPLSALVVASLVTGVALAQDQMPAPLSERDSQETSKPAPVNVTELGGTLNDEGATTLAAAQYRNTDLPSNTTDRRAEKPKIQSANRMVEEIIVTAQKREQDLQDVPISVQAFSADQLDAKGIQDPKQLVQITPGLTYNTLAAYSIVYIRGVGSDIFVPHADQSVATYIDGVYYPFSHGQASALGSIERVEILKGPQGTLFGRNTTGGAISIVTRQPDPKESFNTSASVGYETYDKRSVRLFTNIPLTETLALSMSGLRYEGDSYYKQGNRTPIQSPAAELSEGFSAKAAWNPLDELQTVLGYTYVNTRTTVGILNPPFERFPAGIAAGITVDGNYVNNANAPVYADTKLGSATADIQYAAPWFNVRFIGADQRIRSPGMFDWDGGEKPLVSFEATGQFSDITTAELQLISSDESAPEWLNWIGGVYYIDSTAGFDPINLFVGAGALDFLAQPAGPLSNVTSVLFQTLLGVPGLGPILSSPGISNGINLRAVGTLETESYAFFAQATAKLAESWSLTVGGRYQEEKRGLGKAASAVVIPNTNETFPLLGFGTPATRASNFSPKVTLDYRIDEEQLTYATYAKGYKSGTYNIITIYTPTDYIPPESVTSYELGYKGTVAQGALRFNAAVFQNKITNLQAQQQSLFTGGAVSLETAGGARIRGAEVDIAWLPSPDLLSGLVVNAGAAFLDGKYTSYKSGSGYDELTGLYFGGNGLLLNGGVLPGRDFTGNQLVRTPRWSGNVGLVYAFEMGSGSSEIGLDYYHSTEFNFSAQSLKRTEQPEYGVLNARISYLYDPWGMRFTIFGQNVTDEKYYLGKIDLDFGTGATLAPPAIYGVRVQWDF